MKRIGIAALNAIVFTCAVSFPALGADADPQPQCQTEACLREKIMDFSAPAAQRYFVVERAISEGFDLSEADRSFQQMHSTMASFMGEYGKARAYFVLPHRDESPVEQGYINATSANEWIRDLARDRQALFVNESHTVAETRAAIYTLLEPMRDEGFDYLALEGLTIMPNQDGGACTDSTLFDVDLAERGYPVHNSGFYFREPVFAELVREAIRLGFTLVSYETTDSTDASAGGREQGLASNLACVFAADPDARLMLIGGYAHVSKEPDYRVPGGMMAARFKAMTGIDPLTVDTTRLLGYPLDSILFDERGADRQRSEAYVLSDSTGAPYRSPGYDLVLAITGKGDRGDEEGSWLELDGARSPVQVPAVACGNTSPCLIQAFPVQEVGLRVPSDSCVSKTAQAACVLYLPGGSFNVSYFNELGDEVHSTTVTNE